MLQPVFADGRVEPCSLVTPQEIEQTPFGKLKGAGKPDNNGSHRGEVRCNFDNETGSWLTISIYPSDGDSWSMEKNMMPNECKPIAGLGEEAFSTKRGSDADVRKGNQVLLIRTSSGIAVAKPIAEKAVSRWK